MSSFGRTPVVIDNGSISIKAGFAGGEAPTTVHPSIVRRNDITALGPLRGDNYGRGNRPIWHGIIQNWGQMEQLWLQTLNEKLLVPAERQPLLLTESIISPKSCRQKTAQIVFETLEAPGLYLAVSSVLSLYTSGRTTGIGLSCGGDHTEFAPVYEGFALNRAAPFLPFSSSTLDDSLGALLRDRGYDVGEPVARDIKEKFCYVALDYEQEAKSTDISSIQKWYTLPDGQVISIGEERFQVPELMFNSYRNLLDIHYLVMGSADCYPKGRIDTSIKNSLYSNIVLSGGGCRLPGLGGRLQKELKARSPPSTAVNAVSAADPIYSAWVGGSMLASLSSFRHMLMTMQEYDDYGPALIDRKCF